MVTTAAAAPRNWKRKTTPGNPYASDSTWEVAIVLASNIRCWDLIEKAGLRGEDGRVDAAGLKQLFLPLLGNYQFAAMLKREIDWQEVADEFRVEQDAEEQRQSHVSTGLQEALPVHEKASMVEAAPAPDTGSSRFAESGAPAPARTIDERALTVLRRCTATQEGVFLPPGQLERKLYSAINAVLEALGGKWDRKLKGHRFAEDPRAVLSVASQTGLYVSPKDFGFFPTPESIARQVVAAARLEPGMLVLEPSAGQAGLADLAAEVVGKDNVHAIELLESNRKVLEDKGYTIYGHDFLATAPHQRFDRVIMNPPFESLADIEHVRHAAKFLRPDGLLVAITSGSFVFRETRKALAFRDLMDEAGEVVAKVDAGAFKESGTGVATMIISIDAARLPAEFWGPGDERFAGGERCRDEVQERPRARG